MFCNLSLYALAVEYKITTVNFWGSYFLWEGSPKSVCGVTSLDHGQMGCHEFEPWSNGEGGVMKSLLIWYKIPPF